MSSKLSTRSLLLSLALAAGLSGCGTTPMDSESTREIVLQYLGTDVGTAGPFGKGGKKELDVLSASDRKQAEELIDRGAVLFLVFAGPGTGTSGVTRVVLVQRGKIVGDFKTIAPAAQP